MKRAALVFAVLALGSTAWAQALVPDMGGRVYGLVGGGFVAGELVAVGAGAGLRLTQHIGLDVELTHLTGEDEQGWPWFGISTFGAHEDYPPTVDIDELSWYGGRSELEVTTFLTRFVVEFPVDEGRLFPFLAGGGGLGRVVRHESFPFPIPFLPIPETGLPEDPTADLYFGGGRSEVGLAVTLGGGVDVRLWRGLGVGGEVRWLRVSTWGRPVDVAQAVGRVSYRF